MIDSHCHFDFTDFDHDRDDIFAACARQQVNQIIIPGTRASHWPRQVALCQQYAQLRFALGLHPYFLGDFQPSHLDMLKQTLLEQKDLVVALGEIGLDGAIDVPMTLQLEVFRQQLELAKQLQLPVILHHRKSHHLLIQHLKAAKFSFGGIVHAYSGSLQQARQYQELGFALGIGGVITYQRAAKTRATIKQMDAHWLVLETDAPDMPLYGRQGQRNSPAYLPEVAQALAELRGETVKEVNEYTTANVARVLQLSR